MFELFKKEPQKKVDDDKKEVVPLTLNEIDQIQKEADRLIRIRVKETREQEARIAELGLNNPIILDGLENQFKHLVEQASKLNNIQMQNVNLDDVLNNDPALQQLKELRPEIYKELMEKYYTNRD